jgi:hypothetical protein
LKNLDLFFGDANDAEARVYALMEADERHADCRLAGCVVGPNCEYAQTLTAAIPLVPKRPAAGTGKPALLAEAVLPDPCFWSAELPFLYRVDLELRCGATSVEKVERSFGIRPLGALGRRLVFGGKPWVPRGVARCEVPDTPLIEWRAADAVMVVERPSEELCRESSRLGVLLLAELAGGPAELAVDVGRLARWPSVVMAVLRPSSPLAATIRTRAKNLLLAQSVSPAGADLPADWADLVICEANDPYELFRYASDIPIPVIAQRLASWRDDVAQARRECDYLQRDLAQHGDFAGLLV